MDNQPQYQVGQVANGHMWDGTAWVPVSPPYQSQYQPGQVVNGHVWNGTAWVPYVEPWYQKKRYIIPLVITAILVLGMIGSIETTSPSATSGDEAAAPPSIGSAPTAPGGQQEEPVVVTPGIGDPVRDGKFEFVITGVETGITEVGDEWFNEKPQGTFTLVTMTVANIGNEPQTFSTSSRMEGIDNLGRELAPNDSAGLWADEGGEQEYYTEINPGNRISATAAFDVADGAELVSIIVHDDILSGGAEVSLR